MDVLVPGEILSGTIEVGSLVGIMLRLLPRQKSMNKLHWRILFRCETEKRETKLGAPAGLGLQYLKSRCAKAMHSLRNQTNGILNIWRSLTFNHSYSLTHSRSLLH